jgi:hypothetical protein
MDSHESDKHEARSEEGGKRYLAGLVLRRLTGKGQEHMEQEEWAGEAAADGSVVIKTGRHEIEGTFAVVKENLLVLTFTGHESRSVGRIEGTNFISIVGDMFIKTEGDKL